MKFADIPEVQLLCALLTNTSVDTSPEAGFFSDDEWADIEARSKLLAAINHSRPGGRGASFSTCYKRQRRGEVSELALHKLINKEGEIVTRHDPFSNGEYHYDGVMLGSFKLEYKCLQMMNTNISWSHLKKIEHMLDNLNDIDAIIITKWSTAANYFIPWYIVNPKTVIARMQPSQYEGGLLYTSRNGVPGQDFILLNTEHDDKFFREFNFDEKLDEPDEIIATLDELQKAAQLAETFESLQKLDLDIANHTESFD
jgi:hypothetical protein